MIHRIDRVNPDIDDRVIKPNEARAASNLRFGASVENTNLSGGILLNGNEQLQYAIPAGDNLVVGVMDDFEAQVVYFALYNSQGNHAIYLVRGSDNSIERIVRGAWLNFNTTMNVSMAAIDGKLYWTDNVNQPRMVNVAKGIRTQKLEDGDGTQVDTYPLPAEEWYYTQIKRPPSFPTDIYRFTADTNQNIYYLQNVGFTIYQGSVDYENQLKSANGAQFSYYYIYDNDEESRLAPWSPMIYWKNNLVIQLPKYEFVNYLQDKSLIKRVVFVYRVTNDGVISSIKTIDNIQGNYALPSALPGYGTGLTTVPPGGNPNNSQLYIQDILSLQYVIPNLDLISKQPVSTQITNADFDSVPLVSASNEIAQNRINHGNYTTDYPNWNGLTLDLEVVKSTLVNGEIFPPTDNTKMSDNRVFFNADYSFGIELLDEFGRRIGVVANKTVKIPTRRYSQASLGSPTPPPSTVVYFAPPTFDDDINNIYRVNYTVSGQFPDWCKYYRVVYSKANNYSYFLKTVCKMYFWFEANGIDYISVSLGGRTSARSKDGKTTYTFKGYALELSSGEPFAFSQEQDQYVSLAKEYIYGNSGNSNTTEAVEYKIKKQNGNFIYFETIDTYYPWAYYGGKLTASENFFPLYYQVYLYAKQASVTQIYHETTAFATADNLPRTGQLYGDCYFNAWKKVNQGSVVITVGYQEGEAEDNSGNQTLAGQFWSGVTDWITGESGNPTIVFLTDSAQFFTGNQTVFGYAIATNPTNIYSQVWDSDIGQSNIVNENQRQVRLQNGITFSDPLVQGTQINGLSKFNSVDFRQAPLENGPITSLVTTNATQREPGVLLAIGTYGISSFYYDSIQLTNTDGESNVTTTDKYLASQRPLLGQMGCSQPASITRTPLSTVYWWSDIINDFVRYTNAGLERIGLTHSFGNLLRKNLHGKTDVVSIYDQVTDEVSVWSKTKPHYTFSERFKSFQGERDYFSGAISPERGISLSTKMFHFINGQVWVTDVNSVTANDNQFFGSYQNPSLTIITNESAAVVKQWNQIKVFGPKPISTTLSTGFPDNAEGNTPLLSYISDGWWIERKSDWEAAIRRAYNTPGGVLGGKLMESRILYSIFAFDPQKFTKLNFIEVKNNSAIVQ